MCFPHVDKWLPHIMQYGLIDIPVVFIVIQYLYLDYESWVVSLYNEMHLPVFYSRHTMAPLYSYEKSFDDITK